MTRPFILNADDYGMDAAVDRAILDLAARGIVTATSAMVLAPGWPEAAAGLRGAPLTCGLHLDFTSPFAAGITPARPLPALMRDAFLRRLDAAAVRAAVHEQLHRFETAMGGAPAFVDGHQHVHQFPIIREALGAALHERYGAGAARVALRICTPRTWRGIKAAVIGATGARGLARLAKAEGCPVNSDFAGVYDFSAGAGLEALWRGWLAGLQGKMPLVMCHIAAPSDELYQDDPIRTARRREYAWLMSNAFHGLLAASGAVPRPWTEM